MKQSPIRLGPLALLLTVISICLTILAILTFTTARADLHLAKKYAQTVTLRYELEKQGQELLAEAAAGDLSGWEKDDEGLYWRTVTLDGMRLRIGLELRSDGTPVPVFWIQDKVWSQDQHIDNLWKGY